MWLQVASNIMNTLKLKPCGYQLYSYFQPFWWFCGQLLRIEEELGPKAIYAGENWRPKPSSWKHNQPCMCFYPFYTRTHTHTYTYIVYMCMCMIASIYTKWLSFYHFFFTLFSLLLFLHFGIYRMLNIILQHVYQ